MSKSFIKYGLFLTIICTAFTAQLFAAQNTTLYAYSKKTLSAASAMQRYDTVTSISRKQAADSSVTRIKSIKETKDGLLLTVELADDQQNLIVSAYNLLGKKVLDIYHGGEKAGVREYPVNITSIPSGIYICVVQGDNFRLAEKFFISK